MEKRGGDSRAGERGGARRGGLSERFWRLRFWRRRRAQLAGRWGGGLTRGKMGAICCGGIMRTGIRQRRQIRLTNTAGRCVWGREYRPRVDFGRRESKFVFRLTISKPLDTALRTGLLVLAGHLRQTPLARRRSRRRLAMSNDLNVAATTGRGQSIFSGEKFPARFSLIKSGGGA